MRLKNGPSELKDYDYFTEDSKSEENSMKYEFETQCDHINVID